MFQSDNTTFLERLQDVNLIMIQKIDFYGIFSIISDSRWISDISVPK